jgi:ADP-heptose:LPS heptosyltransferase
MNVKTKQFIDKYLGNGLLWFHIVVVRLLGVLLKRNHQISEKPDTIIVIKMLGLGSLIIASDAIYSLRKRYPDSKLVLLTGAGVAPGIDPVGLFDEIITIRDKSWFTLAGDTIRFIIYAWRAGRTWVIDLEVYSTLTTLLSAWTMAINRFGFELDKVAFRHYLNTHHVYFNRFQGVKENYNQLVKEAGVEQLIDFTFPYKASPSKMARYIAINNTCSDLGGHVRKLPDEQLAKVCTHLIKDAELVFLGAPADAEAIEQFIQTYLSAYAQRVINLPKLQLGFDSYYKFLKEEVKLVVTIDSAPLHIAQKLEIPMLSLWGPTMPQQLMRNADVLTAEYYYLKKPCSPCIHLTERLPCGGNNHCMKDMQATHIINMVSQKLKQL